MATATEEDTELRDLLVQTLETSGVLNKIKAELRAAVFLALEEQEKVENKTPLINESLKKFLNTKDGQLVAGLVAEFLQFFNLDFTLAVFQPESSTLNGLEARENLAQDLGIIEAEATVDGPLLLEVVRRCQQKKEVLNGAEVAPVISDSVHSPPQILEGRCNIHPLPSKINCSSTENSFLLRNCLPKDNCSSYMTSRLWTCSYKASTTTYRAERQSAIRNSKEPLPLPGSAEEWNDYFHDCLPTTDTENSHSNASLSSGQAKSKDSSHFLPNETKPISQPNKDIDTKEKHSLVVDGDDAEGDSFFDDPIPKPEQSYGWKNDSNKEGNLSSLSDSLPKKSGLSSLAGAPPLKEPDNANSILKDIKMVNSKLGTLDLGDEDEYADDFNSTSHRSEKSEASIGEEIDDISVELEDFNTSDKLEDLTQDFTISQLSADADYLEDVA